MCLGCALLKALRLTSSEALRGLHCCALSLGAPKAPLLKLWMVELSSTYLALTLGALFKSMVAWDVMKEPFYERPFFASGACDMHPKGSALKAGSKEENMERMKGSSVLGKQEIVEEKSVDHILLHCSVIKGDRLGCIGHKAK
ncbi:hypothetical protein CK203_019486 [Vitis vinifera]|uniref:Uncharacterized protein n=1 Tax=Vitis vinifera TaxID=29760 RepID=A0A438IZ39_VITVI|nr:hypothetical protein CK203_019486 [Vitis vinifera]